MNVKKIVGHREKKFHQFSESEVGLCFFNKQLFFSVQPHCYLFFS